MAPLRVLIVDDDPRACELLREHLNDAETATQVTVVDVNQQVTSAEFQYVVVYVPSAGFVTGGGWINTLAGSYTVQPAVLRQGPLRICFEVPERSECANRPDPVAVSNRRIEFSEHRL